MVATVIDPQAAMTIVPWMGGVGQGSLWIWSSTNPDQGRRPDAARFLSKILSVLSNPMMPFIRPQAAILARRLKEPRRFIQAIAGPRQVGKASLVQQVTGASGLPIRFASADEPTLRETLWNA
ncbi:MAG: hypothetical protein ABSF61_04170 [Anaerolineales bacterium]